MTNTGSLNVKAPSEAHLHRIECRACLETIDRENGFVKIVFSWDKNYHLLHTECFREIYMAAEAWFTAVTMSVLSKDQD